MTVASEFLQASVAKSAKIGAKTGAKTGARLGLASLLLASLAACSEQSSVDEGTTPPPEPAVGATATPASTAGSSQQLTAERMAQWSRNCALCHVRGEGGAPVLGDRAAWAARLEKGESTLLENTVVGLNNMPPLGYCMDCEEDDFLALIRFMGGER